ncbi:MAG: YqeG family HAD IIIA-type phosphatase [Vampirovibrionales bacterium]|nr:YqeG family HAD IIIA-type phosphatase [Vampirovibrionales bacterium]
MLNPLDTTVDLTELSVDYFKSHGFKAVLMDLDDTLIAEHQGEFAEQLIPWLKTLLDNGLKVGIVSNNTHRSYCHRVLRHLQKADLDIPIIGDALKPMPVSFKRMLTILGVLPNEAVMIGDGILTDQLGGKLAGLKTIRAKCFPRALYYTGPLFLIREIAVCVFDLFRRLILNHRPKLYLVSDSHYRQRQRILVVMNPKSSQTDEKGLRENIDEQAKALNVQVDYLLSDNPPKALKKYRHRLRSGKYDCVAAAGGDGTVRAVIERIFHEDPSIPIAILPTGTGNLMAKGLGIPQVVEEAVSMMFYGEAQSQSITLVNEKYVALLVVGIGLDAEIMHETTSDLKKMTGPLAYLFSGIKVALLKGKARFKLVLRHQGQVQRAEHHAEGVLMVHRNHFLKAFFPMDLQTEKNEKVLDVCVIETHSTADGFGVLQGLFLGDYDNETNALKHYQASEVTLKVFPQEKVQIDGDIVSVSSVHAKLVPDGVSIISPALNPLDVALDEKSATQDAQADLHRTAP